MEFTYRFFKVSCHCGHVAEAYACGSTSDGCLVFSWKCEGCDKDMLAHMDMEEVIKGIPPPPSTKALPAPVFTPQDLEWLTKAHILEGDGL